MGTGSLSTEDPQRLNNQNWGGSLDTLVTLPLTETQFYGRSSRHSNRV
jgi:hypothetical protein